MKIFKIQTVGNVEYLRSSNIAFKEAIDNLIFIKEENQCNGWYTIYFTGKNPAYDGMQDWYKLLDVVRSVGNGCVQEVGHVMWGI